MSEELQPRFYVLDEPRAGSPKDKEAGTHARSDDVKVGEAPICPVCGGYTGMLPWLPPYRIELETYGRRFGDLAFSSGGKLLVSDRFQEVWEANDLKGITAFEPAEVVKVTRHKRLVGDPPRYYLAQVVRSQAAIDQEASGMEREPNVVCKACRVSGILKRWKRVVIEAGTWTGEDLFVARGLSDFIASSRFKEVCDANDLKNAYLIPAEEYGHDFYPWEKQGEGTS